MIRQGRRSRPGASLRIRGLARLLGFLAMSLLWLWPTTMMARAAEGPGEALQAEHPLHAMAAVRGGGREGDSETVGADDVRIPFPVIRAAGALERFGKSFALAGVAVTSPDETCGEPADAWPCGRLALTAIRRFVRTRTISCVPVLEGSDGQPVARCEVGGQDIADWLVTHGWARADGPTYQDAERDAKEERAGLWSPVRPRLAAPAPGGPISTADLEEAAVLVDVSLSSQTLTLVHRGSLIASWPVSTARAGKVTPTGRYRAQWLSRNHRSSLYNNAPMPYSVFFNGDYAIHGTNETGRLGSPASAGCIRLHPSHAAVIFDLARREGPSNTLVIVRR